MAERNPNDGNINSPREMIFCIRSRDGQELITITDPETATISTLQNLIQSQLHVPLHSQTLSLDHSILLSNPPPDTPILADPSTPLHRLPLFHGFILFLSYPSPRSVPAPLRPSPASFSDAGENLDQGCEENRNAWEEPSEEPLAKYAWDESTEEPWTSEEDQRLRRSKEHHKKNHWQLISFDVNRPVESCMTRWNIIKRWSDALEEELAKWIALHKAKLAFLTARQPEHHSAFTREEDEILVRSRQKYGNKWSLIANPDTLPGRSAASLRHRWGRIQKEGSQGEPSSAKTKRKSDTATMGSGRAKKRLKGGKGKEKMPEEEEEEE